MLEPRSDGRKPWALPWERHGVLVPGGIVEVERQGALQKALQNRAAPSIVCPCRGLERSGVWKPVRAKGPAPTEWRFSEDVASHGAIVTDSAPFPASRSRPFRTDRGRIPWENEPWPVVGSGRPSGAQPPEAPETLAIPCESIRGDPVPSGRAGPGPSRHDSCPKRWADFALRSLPAEAPWARAVAP